MTFRHKKAKSSGGKRGDFSPGGDCYAYYSASREGGPGLFYAGRKNGVVKFFGMALGLESISTALPTPTKEGTVRRAEKSRRHHRWEDKPQVPLPKNPTPVIMGRRSPEKTSTRKKDAKQALHRKITRPPIFFRTYNRQQFTTGTGLGKKETRSALCLEGVGRTITATQERLRRCGRL